MVKSQGAYNVMYYLCTLVHSSGTIEHFKQRVLGKSIKWTPWFSDPYQYHLRKFDCLPLENQLSNSQVTKETQVSLVLVYPVNKCVCVCKSGLCC